MRMLAALPVDRQDLLIVMHIGSAKAWAIAELRGFLA
jgi:hypothetical protein